MKRIIFLLALLFPFVTNGQIIITIAGYCDSPLYCCDGGPATNAKLGWTEGVCVDKFNNIYIADAANSRVRKIDHSTGIITTVAGVDSFKVDGYSTHGFSGDNGPAINANMFLAEAVFTDTSGNVYIADAGNNRIRKITIGTGIINTIAGSGPTGIGTGGSTGDGGLATNAQLNQPSGLCLDKHGNVYIADIGNNKIRKIDAVTGIINTIAGTGIAGYIGDSIPATNAELNGPIQVFVDRFDNIFICDEFNNVVRKVTASTGIITTIAGTGTAGYYGDSILATNAELNQPSGVYVDSSENVFIADYGNGTIRKIDGNIGIITTVAGTGTRGLSGDNGPATNAKLRCDDVFLDNYGDIIIADMDNNRIREVVEHPLSNMLIGKSEDLKIYPNPANDYITFEGTANSEIRILDMVGREKITMKSDKANAVINISGLANGIYFADITNIETGTKVVKRIMKE